MAAWIFQGNPDKFAVREYVKHGGKILWAVRQARYKDQIRVGDRVFIWSAAGRSAHHSGVVAVGTICEPPSLRADSEAAQKLWKNSADGQAVALRAGIDLDPDNQHYLSRTAVIGNGRLKDLRILRVASETNYWLSDAEAVALSDAWAASPPFDGGAPIPDGITRDDILQAIRDYDSGGAHSFGPSTKYDLVFEGRRYPPKAILGLAAKRILGRPMVPQEYSGGIDSRSVKILRDAGFEVVAKDASDREWSAEEVSAVVDAYLAMMEANARGEVVNKAAVNRALREGPLSGRTRSAVEFRMQNISSVLERIGAVRLDGYWPAPNVGTSATNHIIDRLREVAPAAIMDLLPTTDDKELRERARTLPAHGDLGPEPGGTESPAKKEVIGIRHERLPGVRRHVLALAAGQCDLCTADAPFRDSDGSPFLEVHHVVTLADGGPDTVWNAVALCPNCHRRLHFAHDRTSVIEALYLRLTRLRRPSRPATHG